MNVSFIDSVTITPWKFFRRRALGIKGLKRRPFNPLTYIDESQLWQKLSFNYCSRIWHPVELNEEEVTRIIGKFTFRL